MSKYTRWLFAEVERWTQAEIITPEQGARLRALYPEPEQRVSWGLILFSSLGAVVVGLGVILLFAYNWNEIPKFGKLGVIFGSIVAAHVSGLWLRWSKAERRGLAEAISLLGTMLFGAGIWLVAQVYNIDEHFPNGFLIWGLGALALAWAMDSVPQAIVATITLTFWGGAEVFRFGAPVDVAPLIVFAAVGPLAWRHRSPILTAVVIAASYALILANASYWSGGGGAFTAAFALSAFLVAAARLLADAPAPNGFVRVMAFFGLLGFVFCSYLLSFEHAVRGVLTWSNEHERSHVVFGAYRWALFSVAAIAWIRLLAQRWRTRADAVSIEEWLCPIALVYCQGLAVTGYYQDAQLIALVFNLVCLGVATMWMVRGCREGQMRLVVLGSVCFAALIFARYFDLFESLAVRGTVFLVLGGVLFAEGFFYRRLRHGDEDSGGRA